MKSNFFEKYSTIFWIIIIGSLFGFIHENLLTLLKGQIILRQGLIYEPLIPIYGLGLLIFYFIYHKLDFKSEKKSKKIFIIFIIGFIVGGVTEYVCSFVQEKVFGTISWDYSYLKLNFNGRTSIFHCICWGLIGILFYQFILPLLRNLQKFSKNEYIKIITLSLSVVFILDCTISALASYRQSLRRNNIEPSNFIEEFLDNHYTDEYLNRIYSNAEVIK